MRKKVFHYCKDCGKLVSRKCFEFCNSCCQKGKKHNIDGILEYNKTHGVWNKNLKGIHLSPQTEFKKGKIVTEEDKKRLKISSTLARAKRFWSTPKGKNHYRWIENRTLLKDDAKERSGQLMREWSRKVKYRDNWKCHFNNKDCNGIMEAHHILGWTAFPELRYDVNNGITLCHYHHPRKRAEEARLSPYFKEIIKQLNN